MSGKRSLFMIALFPVLACAESEPAPRADAVVREPAAPTADAIDSLWYHRVRLLDVTGDGRLDTLEVQARGASTDSSVLSFRVVVDGKLAFTDTWSSAYELVDPPPEAATPAGRDSVLRASLDTTLARIRVRQIDTTDWSGPWSADGGGCMDDPRDCVALELRRREVGRAAFDTAAVLRIADDMRRPGAVQFSLSYGYETTLHLAWSPSAQAVFVIHACC